LIKKILLSIGLIMLMSSPLRGDDIKETIYSLSEYDNKQLACLTKNIYYEAGSESLEGKLAVAQVTLNRVESGRFPKEICKVVYQKSSSTCQFSWVCQERKPIMIKSQQYKMAELAARVVMLEGWRMAKLQTALYFHAIHVNPNWNRKKVAKIGNHIFYS
jgi:spore germination cell wall hydrolase CwlJ-like protein